MKKNLGIFEEKFLHGILCKNRGFKKKRIIKCFLKDYLHITSWFFNKICWRIFLQKKTFFRSQTWDPDQKFLIKRSRKKCNKFVKNILTRTYDSEFYKKVQCIRTKNRGFMKKYWKYWFLKELMTKELGVKKGPFDQ